MTPRSFSERRIFGCALAVGLASASAACSSRDGGADDAGALDGTAGDHGVSLDAGGDDGHGVRLDIAETPPVEECAGITAKSTPRKQPADIFFVVDNSGSMVDENAAVQDNLNAFSARISDAGIDVRVTLISRLPWEVLVPIDPMTPAYVTLGICVDPPLGNGGCPESDDNGPAYKHIDTFVNSDDALNVLNNTAGQWQSTLRAEAATHVVIVTDDNARFDYYAADEAGAFLDAFAEITADPTPPFMHGVVALTDCEHNHRGELYIELADRTDGELGDLCLQDFEPVFERLSNAVVERAGLSCSWALPAPPDGSTLDPNKVNVEFSDGGDTQNIGKVEGPAECADVTDGWYYDDPTDPTEVILCPATCASVQGREGSQIDLVFGCETVPAG